MPWKKTFEETAALDAAMRLFWEKGYEATSYPDLVAASGASRYGLYDLFGDKQQLFLKALDRYQAVVIGSYTTALQADEASLEAIYDYFARLVEAADRPEIRYGCLMVTAAIEQAASDEAIRERVHTYLEWLTALFARALRQGIERGEVPALLPVEDTARYLTGLVQGAAVMARAGISKETIVTVFRTGLSVVTGIA